MNHALPLCALALVPAMIAPAQASAPAVYPTPQQSSYTGAAVRATAVTTSLSGENADKELWQGIPEGVSGAYGISIAADGAVDIVANDETGLFYAKQTLSQLLCGVPHAQDAQRDPFPDKSISEVAQLGELPVGIIRDWPDLPYRGTVEGYYGIPWSFEARLSQFDFYGRNKMNFYIYAPKDDPLHHGQGCYQPYSPDKQKGIRDMVAAAKRNHVHFVWAIHPANTVKWDQNEGRDQLEALCRKLEMMYELGVRDFGVLVDDSFGEIGKPERQVQLTNYIYENFIRKHPDVTQEMVMCPTGYNRSWTDDAFLNTLGAGLAQGIHPMWTGNTVVHDITLEGQQWVNERVKRPTFIWWNWPCNDIKPSRLSMGRTYGLDQSPEMKRQMSGFVANPMERPEANKVALFGVADYTWNIEHFDSVPSWKAGIARLFPQCADAMQVFCNHNSDLSPNNHGYVRSESDDFAPMAERFCQAMAEGKEDAEAAAAVKAEFEAIHEAGWELQQAPDMVALQQEIKPWLRAFTLTGEAGEAAMAALAAEDTEKGLQFCYEAGIYLDDIANLTRDAWKNNHVEQVSDVQVGARHVTTALNAALKRVNARLYATLAGVTEKELLPVFTCNNGNAFENANCLTDNTLSTSWCSNAPQQAGDWYCLDMGKTTEIWSVDLLLGAEKRPQQRPEKAVLEISDDGETWTTLQEETDKRNILCDMRREPAHARYLRLRITKPTPGKPLSITAFRINCPLPAMLSTTMEGLKGMYAYDDESCIGISRVMEVAKAPAGSEIRLELPLPVNAVGAEFNLDNDDLPEWAEFRVTLQDGTETPLPITRASNGNGFCVKAEDMPKQGITGMLFTNRSDHEQEIRLNTLALTLPPYDIASDAKKLRDHDLSTFFDCKVSMLRARVTVPYGSKEALVLGSADVTVDGKTPADREGSVARFPLSKGAREMFLVAPQQDGRIYEVIFR